MSNSGIEESAARLVAHIGLLPDFAVVSRLDYGNYEHMGATITDAILQAGLNWKTVVEPRVRSLRKKYPEGRTTTGFLRLAKTKGMKVLIGWKDDEKPRRIIGVAQFLRQEGVETENDLQTWLRTEVNVSRLMRLRGVGEKTADYLKMLAGIPTVAIDRHLSGFLKEAGINIKSYVEAKQIVEASAKLMGLDARILDLSIWQYMAGQGGEA